jgi:hypothetical protein
VRYGSRIHPLGFKTSHQNVFRSVEEGGWMIPYERKIPRFPDAIERAEECDSLSAGFLALSDLRAPRWCQPSFIGR